MSLLIYLDCIHLNDPTIYCLCCSQWFLRFKNLTSKKCTIHEQSKQHLKNLHELNNVIYKCKNNVQDIKKILNKYYYFYDDNYDDILNIKRKAVHLDYILNSIKELENIKNNILDF